MSDKTCQVRLYDGPYEYPCGLVLDLNRTCPRHRSYTERDESDELVIPLDSARPFRFPPHPAESILRKLLGLATDESAGEVVSVSVQGRMGDGTPAGGTLVVDLTPTEAEYLNSLEQS